MKQKRRNRDALCQWLSDIISEETEKPICEIDGKLIEECERFLEQLLGPSPFTEAQLRKRAKTILQKTKKNTQHRNVSTRILYPILASCAMLLLCFGITVSMVQNHVGQFSPENETLTVERPGTITEYSDMEDFLNEEAPNILYPHTTDSEFEVQSVTCINTDTDTEYMIHFVDQTIFVRIQTGEHPISSDAHSFMNSNQIQFHIIEEKLSHAVTVHNNQTYYITACDTENMLKFLETIF